jgi:hypothetical protein
MGSNAAAAIFWQAGPENAVSKSNPAKTNPNNRCGPPFSKTHRRTETDTTNCVMIDV